MNILRANIAQLAEARLLLNEYFEAINVVKRDSPSEIEHYLTDPGTAMWIANIDNQPAGCVILRPLQLPGSNPGATLECKRLYVRPNFRGQKIADKLLDTMEAFAPQLGSNWIYLDSKDDLKDAIRLYLRRGYETCDRYNDNPQATIFLRKHLPPIHPT